MTRGRDWLGEWEYMPGGAFWAELEGRHVWYMVASDGGQYVLVPPRNIAKGLSRSPWELYYRSGGNSWIPMGKYEPTETVPVRPFRWAEDQIQMHECVFGWLRPKEVKA